MKRKFHITQALPIWTPAHSDTANLVAQEVFQKLGVTDFSSYWRQMQWAIVPSIVICACIGSSMYGAMGFFLGGLLGVGAPAAAIFFAVVAVLMALFLGIFFAAWVAIYYTACRLLGS